ncbi:HlyD family efflux transporter periplasmic adaptor subunit [Fulvimonas sp. R45]|uniref:HlyD family efflux transporter periplasmic adaptor subunit n=1 Tax=Fulvimonas sp. R45 TaxID=3045937 RepID=UPI00265F8138|nr:HlyD family efflux transporter periplasmic adaptor subunit [Fulvimonas sp. R45]MDO1527462.1 HlyD family efflux transporter periplasmic adaptor subunit [Fulvimonas sp. R45]
MNTQAPVPQAREARPAGAWERFLAAGTSDTFCSAWLALLCEKFPAVQQAAVLVEASDGQSFVPIAVWPTASTDMGRMGAAVQQALGGRRIVVQPVPEHAGLTHVAMPLRSGERLVGAVALEGAFDEAARPALLRELHWGSAWLANMFGQRELEAAQQASERSLGVLETIAVALRHPHFQQALFELCNTLRQRFGCSRVAIGLVRDARARLAALSETATFEKSSPMVRAYAEAMDEACDLGQAVHTLAAGGGDNYRAHNALLQRVGAGALISIPVDHQARTIAVLLLEREDAAPFDDAERRWLETFSSLFSPVVAQRRDAERHSLQRLGDEIRRGWAAVVGPRYLLWKAGALLAAIAVALLVWLPVPYRVSAKTVTEGAIQRVAAAPFEGYLAASFARAGDVVRKGQTLARLDDHDLRVEQARWSSERDQYRNKLREAMAGHDLTAIRVVTAQLDEAQAQLDLTDDKLAHASVTAPYDGVVVTGDLSQQIGTPVEAGKKLFEIAPLHSYRIILEVDERDIGQVRVGQSGELVMSGLAGDPMPFTVAKIMPVATTQDGKNFYRVEARLKHDSSLLLPGMEGVGKVSIGKRTLGWVLLHRLFDWLRVALWRWSP